MPIHQNKMIKEEKTEYYTAVVRLESWGVSARVRLNPEKKDDPLFPYLPCITSSAETLNEVGQIPFDLDTAGIGSIPFDKVGTYGRAIMEGVRVVEYLSRIIWN